MNYRSIKRILDILLSFLGLFLLLPIMIIFGILIKIESPGPVLFRQKRVGENKNYFYIYKFRTMKTDAPEDIPTHHLKNPDQWITITGRILRKTSLDELPQMINIIKGEMSLVGPRPALWNQKNLIKEREKHGANDVPVGLTGWAQVNGRDQLTIEEKAKLDGEYARNRGFMMDVKCFFLTFYSVFRTKGVVEGGTGSLNDSNEDS